MPFTQDHHDFRKVVRQFVENEINPHVEAWEQEGMMPLHEIFSQMAQLGLLGLEYDQRFGGGGVGRWSAVNDISIGRKP